ncbi:MAG: IS630 family transposase [Chloroflexi bacterium]|nr:IS630 family transposase [Chloroflexota bacterium]
MERVDARKHSPEVQQQLRNQAIHLRKKGWKHGAIWEAVGGNVSTVAKWCRAYGKGGDKAIRIQKRGRKNGMKRTLSSDQEAEVRQAIRDRCPEQLKLPFALWTRRAVRQLVKRLFSIDMPIRTVGEYLKRWGYTPQKPLRRAYEQNPKAVQKWLDEEYPGIEAKAKREKAEIHWGDETGLRNDSQHGRSYAPRGKTPAVLLPAKREHISLISTMPNQGKARFMVYENALNAATLIKFLKRLAKDAGRKVFLILDNLRVHHSKAVKEWLESRKNEIEVFFLPAYSPELNPDEYLNCGLKAGVHSGIPARTCSQLKKKAISHLRMLQKCSRRVSKYFQHPKIAYAA